MPTLQQTPSDPCPHCDSADGCKCQSQLDALAELCEVAFARIQAKRRESKRQEANAPQVQEPQRKAA